LSKLRNYLNSSPANTWR